MKTKKLYIVPQTEVVYIEQHLMIGVSVEGGESPTWSDKYVDEDDEIIWRAVTYYIFVPAPWGCFQTIEAVCGAGKIFL